MKSGKHRRAKRTLMLFPALAVIFLFSAWVYRQWPDSPAGELKMAGEAIMAARDAEAEKYAPVLFEKTCQLYDSAMYCWKKENERFILARDYSNTVTLARQAAQTGLEAYTKASEKARNVHHTTAVTLEELGKILLSFERIYSPLPLQKSVRETFNHAAMIISEAKLAREKSDFHVAEAKLEKARKMLLAANQKAEHFLKSYFSSFPQWSAMVSEAISASRQGNSTLIVVDKMAHQCMVYQGGKMIRSFNAEFGPNWMAQKMHKGDQATPEGTYQVVSKKERRKTIYHKALLLNYPNGEDRNRYKQNVASGKISGRLDIGGLIEIHGHGGQGFNWTNGCVALTNKDMDVIYQMTPENSKVVIVGSTEPYEEYLKKIILE